MRFASTFLLASTVSAFAPSLQASGRTTCLDAKPKVFIDGEAGTTGLQVRGRLESRNDLEVISPPSDLRKDPDTRKKYVNEADAVILCTSFGWVIGEVNAARRRKANNFFLTGLPDDASIEAASWVDNDRTVLIDASTAFRVADDWTYGFPGRFYEGLQLSLL